MTKPITRNRTLESLKVVAGWPGADRATIVSLALLLAATRADAEGYRYFQRLSSAGPDEPLPLTLAGFFQARLGDDVAGALDKLDRAATLDLGLAQYFRGLALAGLPGHEAQAISDLEFVLAVRDQFPASLIRAAQHGLATAYTAAGNDEMAAAAASRAGLGALAGAAHVQFSGFWVSGRGGFRFAAPRILSPAPGVHVAQGYDFGDFAFIETGAGLVAIDAGTAPDRVMAAAADLGLTDAMPVSHLILTHGHFDHIGGATVLAGPGTEIITQAAFPAELDRQRRNPLPFRNFTGDAPPAPAIAPTRLIAEPTALTVGGTSLVLYPTPGGETGDALMVYLPDSGLLFTGDVMMPYLGAPFFAEGSPNGLLDTLAFIGELRPRMLIHGHVPLTDQFTAEAVGGLRAALAELRGQVLDAITGARTLPDILDDCPLPGLLRDHPRSVLPYLVMREHFTERLYHQHTGYWQADGQGLAPVSTAQRAAALDLLAGGSEEPFAAAGRTLIDQGDHALALDIISSGLLRHPGSAELLELRRTTLHRLLESHQQMDPFKYLIYAELAGVEMAPAG